MKFRLCISGLILMTIAAVSGCRKHAEAPKPDPLLSAYDTEPDWTDAQKIIPLSYQQAQGKRIFLRANAFFTSNVSGATPMPRPPARPIARTSRPSRPC